MTASVSAQPPGPAPDGLAANETREIHATDMSFDAVTGEIGFTLPEPAFVKIRLGIREGGPLLDVLADWVEFDAGEHRLVWNFLDPSGRVRFRPRADLWVALMARPLTGENRRAIDVRSGWRLSPEFDVSFPEQASDGPVVVGPGTVPVRITLDPEDRQWLTESKFEIALFIDHTFLAEDEEGLDPYTYPLNTTGLREGDHFLTVNVVGYDGEVGTLSVPFTIERPTHDQQN